MLTHRYWTGDAEPPMEPWLGKVVAALHPNLTDWTDKSLPADIATLADELAPNVLPQDRVRHRANVVRWALLAEFGGTWLDHDVIPLRCLNEPEAKTAAVGGPGPVTGPWARTSSIVNLPEPQHALARWMTAQQRSYDGPPTRCPEASGDGLMARWPGIRTLSFFPLPFDAQGRCYVAGDLPAITIWATTSRRGT